MWYWHLLFMQIKFFHLHHNNLQTHSINIEIIGVEKKINFFITQYTIVKVKKIKVPFDFRCYIVIKILKSMFIFECLMQIKKKLHNYAFFYYYYYLK